MRPSHLVLLPAIGLFLPVGKLNAACDSTPATPSKGVAATSKIAPPEDVAHLKEKARQNDPDALLQLGRAYLEGNGVARDDTKAAEYFHQAADLGNWKAQNNLGVMYANGQGVAKDAAEALKWLEQAARQGGVTAQINLASRLAQGDVLPKNLKEAVTWYEKAAEQGSRTAQHELGRIYFDGEDDLPKNYALAAKWLTRAAGQGDGWSQNTLGVMAELGFGQKQDNKKALEWYRLAAEQGNARGQSNLGRFLGFHFEGIEEDKVAAYKWMFLSSEQGDTTASVPFQDFQRELNPKELAEARRQIQEYKERHSRQTAEK